MKFWKLATVATALVLSASANAALIERLGGLAYYDDVADLTWLADANAAGTTMNWANASSWAAGLIVDGVDGWRLPDTLQPDLTCSNQDNLGSYGLNCTGSEMGNLFYNVLGGIAGEGIENTHNANYDLFSLSSDLPLNYWSSTLHAPLNRNAWGFSFDLGYLGTYDTDTTLFAWAVHSGDVSAVPVPAAVWLFGSGLIGLIGFAKRKKSF